MEYNQVYYGDAYCVNCKDKVNFEGRIKVSDSGRRMAQGKCPQCSTKVNRILGKEPFQEKPIKVPTPPPVAVPLPPEPYATITFECQGLFAWFAFVKDKRQGLKTFSGYTKGSVDRQAMRYIKGYEEIKVYK